ncbi:MAG: glutathione binding-like protein, partial [Pseudomonadota bacterium]
PSDIVAKARVQEWLSTAVNEIMSGPFVVRAIKVFGMPGDAEAAAAKTTALFDVLFEPHLKDREWLVGESATIADIACYSYVARVTEGDFSLENYPAISAWLNRIESLPNFPQMVHAHEFMAGS